MGLTVEWRENRQGELFFVEAERTDKGWCFDERSTYETRWYRVSARSGWVEKADRLSVSHSAGPQQDAHQSLRDLIGEGGVAVGDFHDNAAVLAVAEWKIAIGNIADAVQLLESLREHIVVTREVKSERILLPTIDRVIRDERRKEAMRAAHDSDRGEVEHRTKQDQAPIPAPVRKDFESSRVRAFKAQLVDAAVIVTALSWTHGLLVHDLATLPGMDVSPTGTNLVAGGVLALAMRFVSRSG